MPRCGSTWLANILGRASDTRTVYEPDGPISDVLGAMVATRLGAYPVLRPEENSFWYRLVWDLAFSGGWPWDRNEGARAAGRRLVRVPAAVRDAIIASLAMGTARAQKRPRHVVVKSVNSAFSLEWISARYHPRIVVLHRNPLNVLSSWMVLDMDKWPVGDNDYVRAAYLDPFGIPAMPVAGSAVAQAAWKVGLLTLVLKETCNRNPDWIDISYDELSKDPVAGCKTLFSQLDMDWTPAAEDFLRRADDPSFVVHGGNPKAHPNAVTATERGSRRSQQDSQFKRRLTEAQIAEAYEVFAMFPLGDWGPPAA
jgi:hypothetical protein